MSFVLAFMLITSTNLITASKSEAALGMIINNRVLKSYGSISAQVGGAALLTGVISIAPLCAIECTALPLLGLIVGGVGFYVAAFGLVLLDDKTVVGLDFLPINESHPDFNNYTKNEIVTYNNELEELNAIKDTLQDELADIKDYQEVGPQLWDQYSEMLSLATVKIAQDQALILMKNISRK